MRVVAIRYGKTVQQNINTDLVVNTLSDMHAL